MPPTVSVDQLGAELRRRRKALGASLRAVEESTEISAATLSRIERGSTPELSIVERLASWLGVQVVASGGAPTESGDAIRTDADLRRTIEIHLRATKHMSDELARSIADTFDRIVRAEAERVAEGRLKGPQDER